MLNKITLIGRLGRDPESKYLQNGTEVSNFSVAADEGYGEKKRTTWFNCSTYGKTAEAVRNHLGKGDLVYVSGAMTENRKDDKSYWRVQVREIKFLSTKGKQEKPAQDQDGFDQQAGF